jgi:hypothetical protein
VGAQGAAWPDNRRLPGGAGREANIDHLHRTVLRFLTLLATLLSAALLIQPTGLHACVNALQCSAGCMAASVGRLAITSVASS